MHNPSIWHNIAAMTIEQLFGLLFVSALGYIALSYALGKGDDDER